MDLLRFYLDPATGEPHIYEHGVSEEEVEEVLRNPRRMIYEASRWLPTAAATAQETTMTKEVKNQFPPRWDEARVRDVIQHYEDQTEEEEAVAEDLDLRPYYDFSGGVRGKYVGRFARSCTVVELE